ncbi:hypothetical protein [Enterobacter sp. RHBSTW-01064]|uniref:hypothetical protein n=1 Tax=Enterobacter sp. RHBSTW-01064 TaxID=2742679 RepID=UPI0020176F35|nr:hypothetical protein [Enterobacter sp. RHBSTW-01064]
MASTTGPVLAGSVVQMLPIVVLFILFRKILPRRHVVITEIRNVDGEKATVVAGVYLLSNYLCLRFATAT